MEIPWLGPCLTLRPARREDVQAIVDLIIASDLALCGESDACVADFLQDWDCPGYDLAQEAWVVETAGAPEGQKIVGYEECYNRARHARLQGDGYVHPEFLNQGIGTALLRRLELRAREHLSLAPADLRVTLRNGLFAQDEAARQLHVNEGYQPVRFFWRMEVNLKAEIDPPVWPAGVELRPFEPDEPGIRQVFEAVEEAFRDHWSHIPQDFVSWKHRMLEFEGFDPALWFVAMEGEQIAGAALCRYQGEAGWVSQLAVRRPWRRRGLALALLQHVFRVFRARGTDVVGLSVDAQNPTGATRVYERAGMQVVHEYVVYEKELRPGRDLTDQEEE